MVAPTEPTNRQGSWLSVLLACGAGVLICVALVFLTLGHFGPVVLIGAAVFAFGAFHYVVWGWWLGRIIRREVEAEEEDAAA